MVDKANVLVGVASITLDVGVDARVIGYTTDGVTMTLRSDFANVKVNELAGTNIRVLTDQEVEISLNMAEGEIDNLAAAIPGASLNIAGTILTLGGGDLQEHRLTLVGITPGGRDRVIVLTLVNPIGEVTTPYKKGDISVVPVTFAALVDDSGEFGEVLDAQAASPTVVSAATNIAGDEIDVTFSGNMSSSAGKHLEFWFTRDGTEYAFDSASTALAVITLTIPAASKVLFGETVLLYYVLGTVTSVAVGVLQSFAAQAVVNNVP